MLKRKMTDRLLEWKNTKDKECLLIKGARQIGKTFIIEDFAQKHYKHFVEINFEQHPEMKAIFDGSLSVPELIQRITLFMPDAEFVPHETLLFLDEIQSCPQARTSLKFWAIDNQYDVIATGSLLGINYKEVSSYPVGYERQIDMYAIDFEEFLWALGVKESLIDDLHGHFASGEPIDTVIHDKMMAYLRQYMVVGGMPAVVNKFIETNNYSLVHAEQTKILADYMNDIAKYAPTADKPKARSCYLSIPSQLAKENTKFQYSVVEKKGTARKFANSLDWLRDAHLIAFCHNVSTIEFPLAAYAKEDQFRIYVTDIGLLIAMYGFEMKRAIIDDTLASHAKGGIFENLMADFLLKKGLPLYYYCKENNSVEVEFLIERNAKPVPIEVKAKRGTTTSLNTVLDKPNIEMGYKFGAGNVGVEGKKTTLPLFMAMFVS